LRRKHIHNEILIRIYIFFSITNLDLSIATAAKGKSRDEKAYGLQFLITLTTYCSVILSRSRRSASPPRSRDQRDRDRDRSTRDSHDSRGVKDDRDTRANADRDRGSSKPVRGQIIHIGQAQK
jgi:hypothetical protein